MILVVLDLESQNNSIWNSSSRYAIYASKTSSSIAATASLSYIPPLKSTLFDYRLSMNLFFLFSWYHGKISRFEAEALLKDQPDCSFLLRDSESSKTDYSLSLRYYTLHFYYVKLRDISQSRLSTV